MSPAHTTTIRVRYAETDQMGVVYYANFFVWFEIGRVELMRSLSTVFHADGITPLLVDDMPASRALRLPSYVTASSSPAASRRTQVRDR